MSNYTITKNSMPDINQAIDLYTSVGWGKKEQYNAETLQKALENATLYCAFVDDTLVGLAKILSDGFQDTFISEILVHPDYQGKGIGKALMQHIFDAYGHTAIYGATPEKHEPFFLQQGMKQQNFLKSVSRKAA